MNEAHRGIGIGPRTSTATIKGHTGPVNAVAFSPDGRRRRRRRHRHDHTIAAVAAVTAVTAVTAVATIAIAACFALSLANSVAGAGRDARARRHLE